MDRKQILSMVDHTNLGVRASLEEIKTLCDQGIRYGVASVCIPPAFVKRAKEYVGDKLKICTVIGFPNGYSTAEAKAFEAKEAVENGADEVDMVINLGDCQEGSFDKITDEIRLIRKSCGDSLLKVIIEACLWDDKTKISLCRAVTEAGADFIKTSTGFSTGGATVSDIALFKKYVGKNVKIKAAGGISSFEDAEKLIEAGADRLGTSRLVKLMEE